MALSTLKNRQEGTDYLEGSENFVFQLLLHTEGDDVEHQRYQLLEYRQFCFRAEPRDERPHRPYLVTTL